MTVDTEVLRHTFHADIITTIDSFRICKLKVRIRNEKLLQVK